MVLAALVSCQVIGIMCTMAAPAAEAVAALHQAQTHRPMGLGGLCADSLPSLPKSLGSSDPPAVAPAASPASSSGAFLAVVGVCRITACPAETGPPCSARPSTLRL